MAAWFPPCAATQQRRVVSPPAVLDSGREIRFRAFGHSERHCNLDPEGRRRVTSRRIPNLLNSGGFGHRCSHDRGRGCATMV